MIHEFLNTEGPVASRDRDGCIVLSWVGVERSGFGPSAGTLWATMNHAWAVIANLRTATSLPAPIDRES